MAIFLTWHFSVRVLSIRLSAFFNASMTLGRSTQPQYKTVTNQILDNKESKTSKILHHYK